MPSRPLPVFRLLPAGFALALSACASPAPAPAGDPVADQTPPVAAPTRSNVRRVPVPYGTRLSCDELLAPGAVGYHMGREVAIEPSDVMDPEATARCWVTEDESTAASRRRHTARQQRSRPSARVCHVTVYCSYIYDEETERNKCSAAEGATSLALGATACRYDSPRKVDMLDADSQCRVVVHAASNDIDVATLTTCAAAAAAELSPGRLRPDHQTIAAVN